MILTIFEHEIQKWSKWIWDFNRSDLEFYSVSNRRIMNHDSWFMHVEDVEPKKIWSYDSENFDNLKVAGYLSLNSKQSGIIIQTR